MAFQFCLFSAVYCKATTPPVARSRAFLNITAKTLYVPIGCAAAYDAAENWDDFENIVETDFSELTL